MSKIKIVRAAIQLPLIEGELPYIASVFYEAEGTRVYKIGVGMTPEEAVHALAFNTAFRAGVGLEDWEAMLRELILKDDVVRVQIPEDDEGNPLW